MKTTTFPIVLAGAAVAALAWALPATADPDCYNPDGSPCNLVTNDGASGAIPGGPTGTATPGLVEGSIPGGPTGQVTPNEVTGCIPGIGCIDVPR